MGRIGGTVEEKVTKEFYPDLTKEEKVQMQLDLEECRKIIAKDDKAYKAHKKEIKEHKKLVAEESRKKKDEQKEIPEPQPSKACLRYMCLGYGNLELYFMAKRKLIQTRPSSKTFAIMDTCIEEYKLWGHHYRDYQKALAKRNYAKARELEELDKTQVCSPQ